MIPSFPTFAPVSLEHQDALEAWCAAHPPLASEYTFNNLFAWQPINQYAVAAYAGGYLIRKASDGHFACLAPLVAEGWMDAVEAAFAYLREQDMLPVLERVGEEVAAQFDLERVVLNEDRANADYVYRIADLIALSGEKYHAKKNLLNQFTQQDYRYLPMDAERARRCLDFAHQWCEERQCAQVEGMSQENCATIRLLARFHELHLLGGVLEVKGEIVAFTLGERLNPDTLVIHSEKADTAFPGAYQAINWEFLRHAGDGFTFVNREQDLGVPGLRKAKQSYHPIRLVSKYRVTPREG